MLKLKHLLKEWDHKHVGPKRWFKPYGDKYTEFEKATNHTNKEPIKENNPLAELDAQAELEDLVRGMSINSYAALEAEIAIEPEDANAMMNWIYSLNDVEAKAMVRRIKNKDFGLYESKRINEVRPFVDKKLQQKHDGSRDGLVYLATNDDRYPTEIVLYNTKRDVLHFLHSQGGNWNRATQETVPLQGFNSTHWIWPYLEPVRAAHTNESKKVKLKDLVNESPMVQAFPKMKPDKTVRTIAYIRQEIQKIENVQKLKDPGFSKYKIEFKKVERALTGLANGIQRHASILASEGKLNEAFKKGDKIKYLDQPGVITRVDNKMGKTFYSVKFKTKTGGIRAADSILSTDGTVTEGKLTEALPKFKTPYEAYSWIMKKRGEAMDIEDEMRETSAEIQQLYGEMEQEAEPAGGPIADRFGKEIDALEEKHRNLRAEFDQIMAEIDEYDQNY
jgi:hypothetical protein